MVASIQSFDKIAQHRKQPSVVGTPEAPSADQSEKLQLIVQLQSTLDIEQLLRVFLDSTTDIVKIDGVEYHEDKRALNVKLGKQSNHSCGYRLINGDKNYGELTFKRSKRFNEDELERIEDLLVLLLVPIRNALKYDDAVRLALHAPVLNISSRSVLEKTLGREIELAKRHNRPLSLLTLRFECSNQKKTTKLPAYITQDIVSIVRANCRDTDILLRTGGKEFLLLMPMEDKGTAATAARIRRDLRQQLNKHQSHGLKVSSGCSKLTGTDSVKSLMERARNQLKN